MEPSSMSSPTSKKSTRQSICVFCGASTGADPIWSEEARAIGQYLATEQWGIVYGAGGTGLMGALAKAALEAGGHVRGIIPSHLVESEGLLSNLSETNIVDNMFERKQEMLKNSDAFLILPGGFGTLDEAFEVLTHKQLGQLDSQASIVAKPIIFWNVRNFWTPLLAVIDAQIHAGFVAPHHRKLFQVVDSLDALKQALKPDL